MTVVLATWLTGCFADRVEVVRQEVAQLEAELVQLRREQTELLALLDSVPPPTQAVRHDLFPEGYDANAPLPSGHPRRPDVVLLSIDTLRADHLGSYGYTRDTSPFLDRLAAEGVRFTEAWSPAPWTLPSHATLLSGQLPQRHGAIEDHLRVADDVPRLPEAFRRAGYRTAGVVATLYVSSRYGFDRGFEHFEDFGILDKAENQLSVVDADHVFAHALAFAQRQNEGQPLFLFLHVYDVHYGYDAPPPFNTMFDRAPEWGDEKYRSYAVYQRRMIDADQLVHQIAQYDEEIRFVDHAFEAFLSAFSKAGRDVLVAVTADHGEEFGERGSWGHGHTLWPEQLHVPWILHGPGVQPAVVDIRVGLEDISATLADLSGVRFATADGQSRARLVRGQRARSSHEAAQLASTSRFHTLQFRWHEGQDDLYVDMPRKTRALCDRSVDPNCRTNRYRQEAARGQALFQGLIGKLGQPWKALRDGTVVVDEGIAFRGTERHNTRFDVTSGDRFLVVPGDARVIFQAADGTKEGPYRPLGGTVPGRGCGLSFDGRAVVGAELPPSDAEREMLRQLGYLQEEPSYSGEDGDGPVDCG
ncbi:MAG: sulfatase [Myxococcota bacterium]